MAVAGSGRRRELGQGACGHVRDREQEGQIGRMGKEGRGEKWHGDSRLGRYRWPS